MADLILTGSPYNTRFDQELPNSNEDQFNGDDMSCFVTFCPKFLFIGSHGHIFKSAMQISPWADLFRLHQFGKFFKVNEANGSDDQNEEKELE